MKNIGLLVAIVYTALAYGSGYITSYAPDLIAVGVGQHVQNLVSGAFTEIAKAIGAIALWIGFALPSIRGESIVSKGAVGDKGLQE